MSSSEREPEFDSEALAKTLVEAGKRKPQWIEEIGRDLDTFCTEVAETQADYTPDPDPKNRDSRLAGIYIAQAEGARQEAFRVIASGHGSDQLSGDDNTAQSRPHDLHEIIELGRRALEKARRLLPKDDSKS